MRSGQISGTGLGEKSKRLANQGFKRPEMPPELIHLHNKDRTTKGKAITLLSSQRNSPRGVDFKESPRDVPSNRKMALISQATSFKGSESHHLATEPDLPINTSATQGIHNFKLHPYEAHNKSNATNIDKVFSLYKPRRGSKETSQGAISNGCVSPSSMPHRVDPNQFNEGLQSNPLQQQTRNQGHAYRVARKSTDHTGNAEVPGNKNQAASKYVPSTDLQEMRVLRDQARRMKNNSHYTQSTQPQIVTSLPSGKITISRALNAESSKDIKISPNHHFQRPPGGIQNKLIPPITQSQGLFFQKPEH